MKPAACLSLLVAITACAPTGSSGQIAERVMAADTNADGVLTLAEIEVFTQSRGG
ncbi:MAG: hypothetical protein AAFX59_16750 [Pseudomonadota bacterium]